MGIPKGKDAEIAKVPAGEKEIPLCVDLDGTLINTDSLVESISIYLKANPLGAINLLLWLMNGKAFFKAQVAAKAQLSVSQLPYNKAMYRLLNRVRREGRKVYLVTGAHKSIANEVARHLKIFKGVYASSETINLTGQNKAYLLEKTFGRGGFDYCGDSKVDLKVWGAARKAYLVNGTPRLAKTVASRFAEHRIVSVRPSKVKSLIKVLRPHQWSKERSGIRSSNLGKCRLCHHARTMPPRFLGL